MGRERPHSDTTECITRSDGAQDSQIHVFFEVPLRFCDAKLRRPGESVQPYDADYWRSRAQEARAIATVMTTPDTRREMQQIAAAYERLADRAERTEGRKGSCHSS